MSTDDNYDPDKMLPGVLHNLLNGGRCRSCGRTTDSVISGHDGFCPVPALVEVLSEHKRLELALAKSYPYQGDINKTRVICIHCGKWTWDGEIDIKDRHKEGCIWLQAKLKNK